MTPKQQLILDQLNSLSLKEAATGTFGGDVRTILSQKQGDWYHSSEYKEECRLQQEANLKKRQTKAEREKLAYDWAIENLKPGMYVKMSGTRDGHGTRKVVGIERGQIICRKLESCWRNDPNTYPDSEIITIGWLFYRVMHDVTTHGAEKLTHTYEEKDGRYMLTPIPV